MDICRSSAQTEDTVRYCNTEQSPHHRPSKQTHAVPIDTLTMLYHGVSSLIDDIFVDETVEVIPRTPSHLRCQSQAVVQRRDHLKGGSNKQQKGSDLVVFGRHLELVRLPNSTVRIRTNYFDNLSTAKTKILGGPLTRHTRHEWKWCRLRLEELGTMCA